MGDAEAMRPPISGPRPPFPGAGMPPRPMGAPPRGPMNMPGAPGGPPPRPMPAPLRNTDSRGNLLMGPGPGAQRPPPPPLQNIQMRPPSGNGGPMSPPGQGQPRPPGAYPWSGGVPGQQMPAGRPPNPYPGNLNTRPPFARPPGAPQVGAQQPPPRPPFHPQPPQQSQQQQPHQQQQPQQSPIQQQPPPRPPSAGSNNNEDDDDVVMGQAITPRKTPNLHEDPMGPALSEDRVDTLKDTFGMGETLAPIAEVNANGVKTLSSIHEMLSSGAENEKQQRESVHKGDNDSGVDESTQEKERNGPGSPSSPAKTPTSTTSKGEKTGASRPPSATPSNKSSKSRSTSRNRLLLKTPEPEPTKKVPMNKIQVGHAPSPNLKAVRSKIGSLDNAGYKPGGGNVKIESKKIEIKAAPRIEAKNDKYTPRGGEKKIISTKLQWNAKSKIGSLENANHKPGGGDKKIETIKTDFKDKAKPKVGSKDNVKHAPGGGDIKNSQILKESTTAKDIQTQKVELKAQSKVGSLDNIKHKPGGGERKIFDDKDYLKNVEHTVALTPPTQNWKVQKVQRATTITSSMSLPAECLVLSVSMPSLNAEQKRPKSAGPKKKQGQAVHPKPFRLY
ncbi:microtubule-associated protein tau isoform X1 [Zeugodacus cucurbitae]|uniref:microtubule-associated protein tau isoform X1 n=1 Tax=Zeugodacus cucurbitae TaxID=28588 RepID=UPI0023D9164C|nr:microtubule-associated protein tau isoform X1 [Zeugodacus cucurbitae]